MVLKCFSGVFASISDACFKCFICLQTYVASVASGCFKSRSVLHLAPSSPRCLHLLLASAGHPNQRSKQAPRPPLLLDSCGAAGHRPPRVARAGAPFVPWFRYASGRALHLLRYSVVL